MNRHKPITEQEMTAYGKLFDMRALRCNVSVDCAKAGEHLIAEVRRLRSVLDAAGIKTQQVNGGTVWERVETMPGT